MKQDAPVKATIKVKLTKMDENGIISVDEKEMEVGKEEVDKLWQSQMQH